MLAVPIKVPPKPFGEVAVCLVEARPMPIKVPPKPFGEVAVCLVAADRESAEVEKAAGRSDYRGTFEETSGRFAGDRSQFGHFGRDFRQCRHTSPDRCNSVDLEEPVGVGRTSAR